MKFSRFTLILSVLLMLPVIASCQEKASAPLTTIILVRHAEKASEPADNPSLTEKGYERAELLKNMLTQVEIDAIYSTPYLRTTETVSPIAASREMDITEYNPRQDPSIFLENILKEHQGKVVVVCGHSNTIPVMLNRLTGRESYQQLDEMEYEDLFMATLTGLGDAVIVNLNIEPAE